MLSIIFFMIVNLLPERRWKSSLPRWTGTSMEGSALRSSWARCRWSNYHDYFKHRKNSNIEIITNIAKVTFIINTKGPQFVGIFCVFCLTLESLFLQPSIFSVLWLHFPSTAFFHLWVCPNLQCFDLLNFLFTNRPSPSSYKQNHKKQEQEKRSMQYFLLWTKCANIRKALLRNSSRTWTKMAMGLWLKRYTLSKTSNCFLS